MRTSTERDERKCRELERRVGDLTDELDNAQRLVREKDEQREQERRERVRAMQPSNRLYNGLITNPREALEAHTASLEHEARLWVVELEEDAPEALKTDPWPAWIAEAKECLREYDATVGAAQTALAARWKAEDADSLRHRLSECMTSGDYSPLAI
jgi:hypothetical protein